MPRIILLRHSSAAKMGSRAVRYDKMHVKRIRGVPFFAENPMMDIGKIEPRGLKSKTRCPHMLQDNV